LFGRPPPSAAGCRGSIPHKIPPRLLGLPLAHEHGNLGATARAARHHLAQRLLIDRRQPEASMSRWCRASFGAAPCRIWLLTMDTWSSTSATTSQRAADERPAPPGGSSPSWRGRVRGRGSLAKGERPTSSGPRASGSGPNSRGCESRQPLRPTQFSELALLYLPHGLGRVVAAIGAQNYDSSRTPPCLVEGRRCKF
jgi:hypothetical protein